MARIDAWIAAQPVPRPSRPEAIRRILSQALVKPADAGSIAAEDRKVLWDGLINSGKPK
jgi:hypothetical protein